MAKKKADFRVWIDGELHAPLTQLAKEHASTVPRQANRILRDGLTKKSVPPMVDIFSESAILREKIRSEHNRRLYDLKTKA